MRFSEAELRPILHRLLCTALPEWYGFLANTLTVLSCSGDAANPVSPQPELRVRLGLIQPQGPRVGPAGRVLTWMNSAGNQNRGVCAGVARWWALSPERTLGSPAVLCPIEADRERCSGVRPSVPGGIASGGHVIVLTSPMRSMLIVCAPVDCRCVPAELERWCDVYGGRTGRAGATLAPPRLSARLGPLH